LFAFASQKLKVAPSALSLEQLDAALISTFLEHLETTRGNSAETRNVRLAAFRSFFRFLQHREPGAVEQVRRVLAIPFKKTDTRCQHRYKTTAFPSVLLLGREAYGEDVVRTL
jgi:site-specific recombinase XerD